MHLQLNDLFQISRDFHILLTTEALQKCNLILTPEGQSHSAREVKELSAIQKNAMCFDSDPTLLSFSLDPLYCSVYVLQCCFHSCVMLSTATIPIDLHNLPTHSHCLSPAIPEKNCLPITTVSLYPTPDPHIIKVHTLSYLLQYTMEWPIYPEFSSYCVLWLSLLQKSCVYTVFL